MMNQTCLIGGKPFAVTVAPAGGLNESGTKDSRAAENATATVTNCTLRERAALRIVRVRE